MVTGSKRHFGLQISKEIKRVRTIAGSSTAASGAEGGAYDLVATAGKHKLGLVIKKRHDSSSHKQITLEEYKKSLVLKQNHFHVPPTTRLIKI